MLLEYADNSLGITNRIIAGLDELGENTESYLNERKNQALSAAGKAINEVIDYAVLSARVLAIRWVQNKTKEYLSPLPRVR